MEILHFANNDTCDNLGHYDKSKKDVQITNYNMYEMIPKNTMVKCDICVLAFMNSAYFGMPFKIGGINVVSYVPELRKLIVTDEDKPSAEKSNKLMLTPIPSAPFPPVLPPVLPPAISSVTKISSAPKIDVTATTDGSEEPPVSSCA